MSISALEPKFQMNPRKEVEAWERGEWGSRNERRCGVGL